MRQRTLGRRSVGVIGLGAMPLSVDARPPRALAIRTIHAALDAGVSLIDTADAYCRDAADMGHNEQLVAEALASFAGDRNAVVVATKGGHVRGGDGSWSVNGRPEYLRQACVASLQSLGVERIDLYQYHRPDPDVPVAESIGALADLQAEGKIDQIGVSNLNRAQLDEARSVADLASVQNEFSPAFQSSADEVDYCAEHHLAFLAWSPLGGMGAAGSLGRRFPAFDGVAQELGVSPQRVALAWTLLRSDTVIAIPGASRVETITDSAAAADLQLSPEQVQRLDAEVAA